MLLGVGGNLSVRNVGFLPPVPRSLEDVQMIISGGEGRRSGTASRIVRFDGGQKSKKHTQLGQSRLLFLTD